MPPKAAEIGLSELVKPLLILFVLDGDDAALDGIHIHLGDALGVRSRNVKRPNQFAVLLFQLRLLDHAIRYLSKGRRFGGVLGNFGISTKLVGFGRFRFAAGDTSRRE